MSYSHIINESCTAGKEIILSTTKNAKCTKDLETLFLLCKMKHSVVGNYICSETAQMLWNECNIEDDSKPCRISSEDKGCFAEHLNIVQI